MSHLQAAAPRLIGEMSRRPDFKAGISRTGEVKTHYHYWSGASGRTYLHTVYSPDQLPPLVRVVVMVVARAGSGRRVLFLAQAGDGDAPITGSAGYRQALQAGGTEVHVHFLAGSTQARQNLMQDLAGMINAANSAPVDLAA